MRICSQCGTKLGKKDKYCLKCGSSLYSDNSESKIKYCLYCGEMLDMKAKFCNKCGKQCDGNVTLGFLSERKEGSSRDALEFLRGKKSQDANNQQLSDEEKEKATLRKFEAQVRARVAEKAAKDLLNDKIKNNLKTENAENGNEEKIKKPEENIDIDTTKANEVKTVANLVENNTVNQQQKPLDEDAKKQLSVDAAQAYVDKLAKEAIEFMDEKKAVSASIVAREEVKKVQKAADDEKLKADKAKELVAKARDAVEKAKEALAKAKDEEAKAIEASNEADKKLEKANDAVKVAGDKAKEAEEFAKEKAKLADNKRKELEEIRKQEIKRLEDERFEKEEEERKLKEEEERKRKEEEERKRKEEEERKRKEEEERQKEEEQKRKALEELHKTSITVAKEAIAKFDKSPENGRQILEQSLDRFEELYKKKTDDMDVSDTEDLYHNVQERLGIMYYQEGSMKLAMPLIDASVENGSKKAAIYKAEWYSKNRAEIPKEENFLRIFAEDALTEPTISKDEKILLYLVLAKILHDGIGAKRDLTEAFKYYEKAAELESVFAYAKIGQCYLYAEGVKKDGKLALEWSRKAAEEGDESGIRNVAICYDFGTGTKRNADEAIEWYKKLLDRIENDRFAMYRMATCLADPDKEYGRKASDEDYVIARNLAEKALEGGEENANYVLGYLYMMGKGVARDFNKAVYCFSCAANYGNSKAKEKMKLFVKNGSGNYVLK